MASISASGPAENRPPQSLLVRVPSSEVSEEDVFLVMKIRQIAWCAVCFGFLRTCLVHRRKALGLPLLALGLSLWALPTASADDGPPAFRGAVRQFTLIEPPRKAPFGPIRDAKGDIVDMSRYAGKVLLVNFWATWCAPCVIEMPTLDRLQAALGGKRFAVLTISVDQRGMEKVGPFFKEKGYRNLPVLLDTRRRTFQAFSGRGLPTTYLIDHRGYVIGYLEGHAEWDSPAARRLIDYYLARAADDRKK